MHVQFSPCYQLTRLPWRQLWTSVSQLVCLLKVTAFCCPFRGRFKVKRTDEICCSATNQAHCQEVNDASCGTITPLQLKAAPLSLPLGLGSQLLFYVFQLLHVVTYSIQYVL